MKLKMECNWCGKEISRKRMTVKCDWCDLEFEKKRSDVNRSNHNFCKPECGHSFKRWTGVCGYSPLVGGVPIHRKIMEETLGRKLTDNEEVHHIDFNHHNNHIENLVVLSKSEHSRIHAVSKERDVYGRFIDQK